MSWTSGLRRRTREEHASPSGRPRVSLELEGDRFAAGEPVVARLRGATGPAAIALVRVETRPCGTRPIVVAERRVGEPQRAFELPIPPSALPTARGGRCALSYVLQARLPGVVVSTGLAVTADGLPQVESRAPPADRIVACWGARHFHLELSEAVLAAGGRIAGRVHRHGSWCADAIAVGVRCCESWRQAGPAARGMPFWGDATLWEAEDRVRLDEDARWSAFGFDLPPGLPPAIEARTIAWRYEVLARRALRHRPDETAALTPLRFVEQV